MASHNRATRDKALKERGYYLKMYSFKKRQSQLLNPRSKPGVLYSDLQWSLSTKQGAEALLQEYETEGEGTLTSPYGIIQKHELDVQAIEKHFERLRQSRINSGHKPPKVMPKDMQQLYDEALAMLDIKKEERDKIANIVSEYQQAVQKERKRRILSDGPCGTTQGVGDRMKEIDGQQVQLSTDGILYIDDPESPYHKMTVMDYREYICEPASKIRKKEGRKKNPQLPWPDDVKKYEPNTSAEIVED